MANGRLYVVESDEMMSIVRSVSPAQALNHIVKDSYKVRVASADDVAEYMAQGGEIEDSTIKIGSLNVPDPALGSGEDGDVPV